MVTALDTYLPFASGAGSNVTEDEWRDLAEQWFPTGVVHGYANEFLTTQRAAGANMSVDVDTGQARVRGHEGISTSVKNLAVTANATGNPRIDTVVLRGDFVNDTIGLDVLAGTAAVNPVPPALTQNTSTWEVPLYDIIVAAAAASIATADLRDRRPMVFQLTQSALKEPVRLATAAAMAASTVVGNVRTANANGAMATIDGVAPAVGDRVLDKDNATGANRGIWRITDVGSASQPWRMERPDDFNSSADVRDGVWVTVNEGTVGADTGWLLTTNDPIVLGSTSLAFSQFPAPAGIVYRVAVETEETTTSITYANTATVVAKSVTVVGTAVKVSLGAQLTNDTSAKGSYCGVAVSGATTVAASDSRSLIAYDPVTVAFEHCSLVWIISGLTPGVNTFTVKQRTDSGGTCRVSKRELLIEEVTVG